MYQVSVKHHPQEIDAHDPWKDDALKTRQYLGQRLIDLISSQQQPLSICIDGSWGSGKTFFVERWETELRNNGFQVIHFNAWEEDFFDDPMPALVGQLWRDLGFEKEKSGLTGELSKDAKTVASFLWRFGRKFAIHAAKKKSVDVVGCDSGQLDEFVSEDITNAGSILDEYNEFRESQDEFGKALERLVKAKATPTSTGPCVFVVDELDRCQPLFAVKVLERIKHFLSIQNLVFVFCVDKENLGKSLKAVYGEIDVENYLYRFFDFVFPLTSPDKQSFCDELWNRYQIANSMRAHDAECHDERDCLLKTDNKFHECFSFLASYHHLTFREIEYVFRSYLLVLRDNSIQHRRIQPHLLAMMLFLRLRNRPLANRFIHLGCSPAEVIDELLPEQLAPETAHIPIQLAVAVLYAFYPWSEAEEDWSPMNSSQVMQVIHWTHSIRALPEDSQDIPTSVPEYVPMVMRKWKPYDLRRLSDWTRDIKGQMQTAFQRGNPLTAYEVLVNLMESPPSTGL
jgi:hypothetical protein